MTWKGVVNMNVDEGKRVHEILKMEKDGKNLEEIADKIGYTGKNAVKTMNTFMRKNGWYRRKGCDHYIKRESNKNQNNIKLKENVEIGTVEHTYDINRNNLEDNKIIEVKEISDKSMDDILEIIKRKDDILKMLEWFDKIEEPVIVSNELKIEINASNDKKDRKTIFFNPKLWNRFENFCKKNKQFKKHDIINQALYELLERVDNEE